MLSVFFRQDDACIVTRDVFEAMIELNPQVGAELTVLVTSPEFMYGVTCLRKNLDEENQKRLLENAIQLQTYPKGKQILTLFRRDEVVLFKPSYLESIERLVKEYHNLMGGEKKNKKGVLQNK